MVSTRGVKLKFSEGERVLCYEPDPTKAKVLYDSKVLDVIINKDQRGKKCVEYLIHFQGWNSSWDRSVGEEYVLKDTVENRQLQKDLAEKAQLQLGAYLYRRERKKHGRKTSEAIAHSSEDGSSGSPACMDTDDGEPQEATSSSGEDSSAEDDLVIIELPQSLKEILEHDFVLINTKNKLSKLPAEPNVISILEAYWRHYASGQLFGMNEKPNTRNRQPTQSKQKPEDVQRNLNICKEVVDGLRIYFDFTLANLLLYKSEQGQVQTQQAIFNSSFPSMKDQSCRVKPELEDVEYAHLPNVETDEETVNQHDEEITNQKPACRRRGLRSHRSVDSNSNGNSQPEANNIKPGSSTPNNSEAVGPLHKTLAWKLLPDHVYHQKPPPPSLVYGATHLVRLFVKLPELLNATSITDTKLKVLLKHFDQFLEFLADHKEWFGEKFYTDF